MRSFEDMLFATAVLAPDEPAHVLACAYTVNALAQKLEDFIALNFKVTPAIRKTLREAIAAKAKLYNQAEIQVVIPGEGSFEFTLQCGCGSHLWAT